MRARATRAAPCALAAALALPAPPVGAVAPCLPGQRPATVAALRFATAAPGLAAVSAAQWQAFRAEVLEPALGAPLQDAEEAPDPRRPRARWRAVAVEVPVAFDMAAPDRLPPEARAVLAAWYARFPGAPAGGRLRPICRDR